MANKGQVGGLTAGGLIVGLLVSAEIGSGHLPLWSMVPVLAFVGAGLVWLCRNDIRQLKKDNNAVWVQGKGMIDPETGKEA